MRTFFHLGVKKLLGILLACSFLFSMTGCDIIIINDLTPNNVSESEGTENIPSAETEYIPVSYTPYQSNGDSYAKAEEYLNTLPMRSFDGNVFFITTPSIEYIDPDHTENTISRMVYERNRKIEEKYNISIITSLADANTIYNETRQAVDSDVYYTDLVMLPLYMTGQFRAADVLMNLHSLPFINLSAPYFNSESVTMTTAGYGTYGVAGYASLSPSAFSAVFFNRDMVKEAGMEKPYSLVVDGTWTWERFFEYTAAVAELNGSGENAYHTVAAQSNATRLADLVFVSCGNSYIRSERKKVPKIAFSVNSAQYSVSVANRILSDSNAFVNSSANALKDFADGNSLFLVEYLYAIPGLTDSAADWGVVPLPLERENDDYRTLVSNNELIFAVPANHTNGEYASIILSALNAASYRYLYEEYVTQTLTYHLRDNDSANMLERILDSAAFDFSLAFGNSYPAVAAGTYGLIRDAAVSNDLSARYKKATEAAEASLTGDFSPEY